MRWLSISISKICLWNLIVFSLKQNCSLVEEFFNVQMGLLVLLDRLKPFQALLVLLWNGYITPSSWTTLLKLQSDVPIAECGLFHTRIARSISRLVNGSSDALSYMLSDSNRTTRLSSDIATGFRPTNTQLLVLAPLVLLQRYLQSTHNITHMSMITECNCDIWMEIVKSVGCKLHFQAFYCSSIQSLPVLL